MNFKLRPFFKDILLTLITQVVVLISFFFIYHLIAKNFGPEGVGQYSLVKKVVGFLQPIILLGLGVGLPRYISMSQDKEQRTNYVKAGFWIVIIFSLIFFIFINIFKEPFTKIFFGTANYTNIAFPFSLFLAGYALHSLAYSYFRGRLQIHLFNSLQIINLALVPIFILIFFKNITINNLITLIGIITLAIDLFYFLFFIKEFFIKTKIERFKNSFKELICYSFPRFVNSFFYGGLLSLGPIFATHFASIKEVGYLSVSQNLLSAIGVAVAPLGLILLPKISNMIIQKRDEEIKENLNYLIGATIQCSIFIFFQVMTFTDVLIKYWLGPEFIEAIPVMRIIFCAIVFLLFSSSVESVLEASRIKPINLINSSISLGIFLILSGILLYLVKLFSPIVSFSIAFASSIICRGILTYISIRKIYPEKLSKDLNYLLVAIVINILLSVIAVTIKPFIVSRFYFLMSFEVIIGLIYILTLWLLKSNWIRQMPEKLGLLKEQNYEKIK